MSDKPSILPGGEEVRASARLLRLAANTMLATASLLLVAGALALWYMGVPGLSFMPLILLVVLVEIVAAIFLRRRARAMLRALPGQRHDGSDRTGCA